MSRKTPVTRKTNLLLNAILVVSLLLSIVFAVRVPLNGNPDETDHRDYIRLLIKAHGFVRFVPGTPFDTVSTENVERPFETHQSPLYYLLCIPVQIASGGSVFAVRLVSALLQLLTILVVFRAVRDLFPERDNLALGAAAFVALLPTQAQLAAAISNDGLTTLICATIFWKLGRLVQRGQPARPPALLGLLIGLGLLTKISVLQLLPAVIAAYGIAIRAGKTPAKAAFVQCLGQIALGFVIASPWLIRNTMLYGDPFALHVYRLTGPNHTPEFMMSLLHWTFSDYARVVGLRSFATFWYLLPPQALLGPPIPMLVVVIVAFGGLLGTYKWFKDARGTAADRRVALTALLTALLLVPFFVQFVLTVFQAQGRYFLPVLAPVAILTCLGWLSFSENKRTQNVALCTLLAALFILCLYQIVTIPVN